MLSFFRCSRFLVPVFLLGLSVLFPGRARANKRGDNPKGSYGTGSEVFGSNPITFTLSDGTSFTLQSSVRCQSIAPGDCLSANSVFAYFYVITIGASAVSQPVTLQLTAPFDNYNSSSLTFGVLNQLDSAGNGTQILDCLTDSTTTPPTYNAPCIDAVLLQSTNYTNGTLTFNLSPQTLNSHAFQPGDQIWVYATSFSPPACPFDFVQGLACSQSTSLMASLLVSSASGPVSPSSTPGLAPVLPTPGRRLLAPSEPAYFPGTQKFPAAVSAQLNQGGSATPLPGFVASSVDLLFGSNVSYGYLYDIQIPSTLDVTLLPATFTVALSAPYNQTNFEFLAFGVLGTDGHTVSSSVTNCGPLSVSKSNAAAYNACVDGFVTTAVIQGTSLAFTIATANISAGDNLTLFAGSNNGPSICASQGQPCFNSTTPIALAGDSNVSLSVSGSPTTVTGPIQPLPAPAIVSLSPNQLSQNIVPPGSHVILSFPVAIASQNVVVGSQAVFKATPHMTVFNSASQLSATLEACSTCVDLTVSGLFPMSVVTPANPSTPGSFTPNGGTSNSLEFLVANNSSSVKLTQPVVSVTQNLGTTSPVQTIQLQNISTNTLNLTSITLGGPDLAAFALVPLANVPPPACPFSGGSVAVGASCNIGVTFSPTSPRTYYAAVMVADSAPDSPQSAILVGTGLGPPASLTLAPH
jgi:hypothetical protein